VAYASGTVATYYAALFPARVDAYSAWTEDGWRPVREELTPGVVLDALTGKSPPVSGYMIAPGSVGHSMALDFDGEEGLPQAVTAAHYMTDAGLPTYLETSRRGAHLWCVLDDVLPAKTIRRGLRALLRGAGLDPLDPKIELRPGSDHVEAEWDPEHPGKVIGTGLGHALRLPSMPHPKTGDRGILSDADGVRLGATLADALLAIEWAPASLLVEWAHTWRPKVRHVPPIYRQAHDFPPDDSLASDILRDLWGVENARPGRAVRCPAHDDKNPSLNVFPDDRRVMCMTPTCVLHNDGHGRGTWELRRLAAKRNG
jgi:hypothetical protein